MSEPSPPDLTPDEMETLFHGALLSSPQGQTKDELVQVMEWACNARIDYAALELALTRRLGVSIREGEIGFTLLSAEDWERVPR